MGSQGLRRGGKAGFADHRMHLLSPAATSPLPGELVRRRERRSVTNGRRGGGGARSRRWRRVRCPAARRRRRERGRPATAEVVGVGLAGWGPSGRRRGRGAWGWDGIFLTNSCFCCRIERPTRAVGIGLTHLGYSAAWNSDSVHRSGCERGGR